MQEMNPEQAVFFHDRWQAVAQIEAEEARAKTIEQCWLELNAIYRMAVALDLPLKQDPSEEAVYQRWAELKNKLADDT